MFDEKEMKAYKSMITQMLHGDETKENIYQMLQSGKPEQTIPSVSTMVSSQAVQAFKKNRGTEPSLQSLIGGSLVLGTELIEIGNSGGFFKVDDKSAMPLVEKASKAVIQDGLKNGYIDPVELQETMSGGLDEDQAGVGIRAAESQGIPTKADNTIAMEQYATQREKSALEGVR